MRKTILTFLIGSLLIFSQFNCQAANRTQKVFNKLDKQEQLKVLKDMKKQELAQVNSQIKDVKSQIKTVESNTNIPLNKRQQELLNLNRELTLLSDRKYELERKYKLKINEIKNK